MRIPPSELPKFKKLDGALRDSLSAMVTVLHELDQARAGRRTPPELLLLQDIERWIQSAKGITQAARMDLWKRTLANAEDTR